MKKDFLSSVCDVTYRLMGIKAYKSILMDIIDEKENGATFMTMRAMILNLTCLERRKIK